MKFDAGLPLEGGNSVLVLTTFCSHERSSRSLLRNPLTHKRSSDKYLRRISQPTPYGHLMAVLSILASKLASMKALSSYIDSKAEAMKMVLREVLSFCFRTHSSLNCVKDWVACIDICRLAEDP